MTQSGHSPFQAEFLSGLHHRYRGYDFRKGQVSYVNRMASGSTIVDPDQNGSRRAETAGIAADPVARLSASLLFYMAMRIVLQGLSLSPMEHPHCRSQ